MFVPLNEDEFNDALEGAVKSVPVMVFDRAAEERGEVLPQRRNKDGVPMWSILCAYKHERDFEPEFVEVQIAQHEDPAIKLGPIRFGAPELRTWVMGSKRGWRVSATTFTQEPRPSSKRATPPPPPAEGKKAA